MTGISTITIVTFIMLIHLGGVKCRHHSIRAKSFTINMLTHLSGVKCSHHIIRAGSFNINIREFDTIITVNSIKMLMPATTYNNCA